jgi:hypothetical protein
MKVIDPGHVYHVNNYDGDGSQEITFVKRFRNTDNHEGTINQELLRVLIDRVQFLDAEAPWEGNKDILHHLRMALVLHESRALFRKVAKGEFLPELVDTNDKDGHFKFNIGM